MVERRLLHYWLLACAAVLAFGLVVGRAAADSREHEDHDLWFVHATDPHIFLPAAQVQEKETKDVGAKQQELNEKALSDMLKRVRSLPEGDGPPAFLVLTGDLGVDPCFIPKSENPPSKEIPAAQGQTPLPTEADNKDKQNGPSGPAAKDCLNAVDPDKRTDQIKRTAKLLGQSAVQDIYLVAGNNDIANEVADDAALGYFNQFIEDVQAKLVENKSTVHLHNLTRCYASGEAASMCYADIAGTAYRLIGFPSYSFKNAGGDNTEAQAKQFDTFRRLLEGSRQAGKRVLVISDTPEIDDPFVLAQDRYAGKAPAKAISKETNNPRSAWSTWNVSKKVLDDWKDVLTSDSVVAVLAGHLHDSHKEIYRQPYTWSSVNDHRAAFHKLFLAPPLAVKNQDNSPIQARGFSLVHLQPDHVAPRLYWYNSETGDFTPDPKHKHRWQHGLCQRLRVTVMWLWNLEKADNPLARMAVLLIAFLTAFLTIVAIWQIPPPSDPFADDKKTAEDAAKTTQSASADSSPFSNKFGKTVVAGLSGLAVTEVAKALGNQQSTADTRWYYIVWFILFFFLLLLSLNLWRAAVEVLRVRVAVVYYPLGTPGSVGTWDRFTHWLSSLRVPLLTFFDTFINLIQGKNQTRTRVFSDTIIEQQRNNVRVADVLRRHLSEVIQRRLMEMSLEDLASRPGPPQPQPPLQTKLKVPGSEDVRVNISVLSADQSRVFYIARAPGSAIKVFGKSSVAWVSAFSGTIRWYKHSYSIQKDLFNEIILFNNGDKRIPGDAPEIYLKSNYQPRSGEDYEAFVMFPVPWPQRGYGSEYVRGAIHISFRHQEDFERIWQPQKDAAAKIETAIKEIVAIDTAIEKAKTDEEIKNLKSDKQAKIDPIRQMAKRLYDSDELMLGEWCIDKQVRATLREAVVVLGDLLRGFNENIYESSGEFVPTK